MKDSVDKKVEKLEKELFALKNKLNDKEPFKYVRLKDMVSEAGVCAECSKVIRSHAKNIKPIEWGGNERCECEKPSSIGSKAHTELLLMLWNKGIPPWHLKGVLK